LAEGGTEHVFGLGFLCEDDARVLRGWGLGGCGVRKSGGCSFLILGVCAYGIRLRSCGARGVGFAGR
jgi:hypothetical protein